MWEEFYELLDIISLLGKYMNHEYVFVDKESWQPIRLEK